MLELVNRVGDNATHVKQFCVGQIAQRALQILLSDRMDGVERRRTRRRSQHRFG
jgi:hypothetical protein